MAKKPVFDLFEVLCAEMAGNNDPQVIDHTSLADPALIADLEKHFKQTDSAKAFEDGIKALQKHFQAKGAALPFTVDLPTREFTPTDPDYINYIAFARTHRSVGGEKSRDFEIQTMSRIRLRVTGNLHRVGFPRTKHKKKPEMVKYLKTLGFADNALKPRDKDGGLDILWMPPIGTIPLRPMVSLQCKNGSFNEAQATSSAGRARATLSRSHLANNGHMTFVVFNDYIDNDDFVNRADGWIFLPLGLSDLAKPSQTEVHEVL